MSQAHSKQSFTLRIADSNLSGINDGTNHCEASASGGSERHLRIGQSGANVATIDLGATYRTHRVAAKQSAASMRLAPSRLGSTTTYRMAG
jgi:hypothetical protein